MFKPFPTLSLAFTLAMVAACASTYDPLAGAEPVTPAPGPVPQHVDVPAYPSEAVARGRYLVELLGCGSCHTDGALVCEPDPARLLAGSGVGIATSDPMRVRKPAVVYPANLTPDRETGIGSWSLEQIITMLQAGVDSHGVQALPVMPFLAYSRLQPDDAEAIAMYLKSIPAVQHRVPGKVRAGQRARAPYVHFGVYRSEE